MSVGPKQSTVWGHREVTRGLALVRVAYPSCPENEVRDSYRVVDTSGGLAGLVLPLTRYLVHRDSGDALGNLRVEVFH